MYRTTCFFYSGARFGSETSHHQPRNKPGIKMLKQNDLYPTIVTVVKWSQSVRGSNSRCHFLLLFVQFASHRIPTFVFSSSLWHCVCVCVCVCVSLLPAEAIETRGNKRGVFLLNQGGTGRLKRDCRARGVDRVVVQTGHPHTKRITSRGRGKF